MIASIQELLQKEAQAVLNIPVTDAYEKAVELIVEQVHRKKGKLVTSGMGKAGQIAMNIATTFCSTGIPSVFLHPSEAETWVFCRKTTCYCSFPIRARRAKLSS
jgi:arabinose-5-phosphate isomerase